MEQVPKVQVAVDDHRRAFGREAREAALTRLKDTLRDSCADGVVSERLVDVA